MGMGEVNAFAQHLGITITSAMPTYGRIGPVDDEIVKRVLKKVEFQVKGRRAIALYYRSS